MTSCSAGNWLAADLEVAGSGCACMYFTAYCVLCVLCVLVQLVRNCFDANVFNVLCVYMRMYTTSTGKVAMSSDSSRMGQRRVV